MRTFLAATGLTCLALGASGAARGGDDLVPPAMGAAEASGLRPGEVLFRPKAGTKLAFTERAGFHALNRAGRKKYEARGESTCPLDMTIGTTADGATEVVCRWGDAKGSVVSTDKPKVEFDTAKDAVDPAGPSFMLSTRAKRSVTFHVRPDGRIVELDDLQRLQKDAVTTPSDRDRQTEFYAQWSGLAALREIALLPPFPTKRMGAGTTFEDEALPGVNGVMSHRLRRTTTLTKIDDARVIVSAIGALVDLDPANAPGASPKKRKDGPTPLPRRLKSSGFGAGAEYDRLTGLLVKGSYRLSYEIAARFTIDGDTVDGTDSFEWELALDPRPADPSPAPTAPPPDPAPRK